VLFTIAMAAWRAIRRGLQSVLAAARILGVPLVALSACSLLTIAALHDVVRHAAGLGGAFGGPSLWGGLVWIGILILVLAALSFTLNPEAADRMAKPSLRNPSITISFLAAILAPAALIGWLFTAILTLATPALWLLGLALGIAGVHLPELGYGPMLLTSLLALLGLVILGSMPALLAGSLRMRDDRPTYRDSRPIIGGTLVVMACAGALTLVLGWATIIHWLPVAR
jgi:magnesium-transporting ATPase (P-type)